MKRKIIYIINLLLIAMMIIPSVTMAFSSNNMGIFTAGVFQANRYILLSGETTMTVVLSQDANNSKQINITAEDTTYTFVSLKWVKGSITQDTVSIFDTDSATTIPITESASIQTSFQIDTYGTYTVYAKNSNGDIFLARINTISQDVPTITVTKDENNLLKTTIEAEDGEENIVRLKIAKKSTKDEEIDFETQGTELTITPAKKVTVEYTFEEEGIYAINAKDESGNTMTKTVYIYKTFPIQVELSAVDKIIDIKATAVLSDIVKMKIVNTETNQETELDITKGREVEKIYEAPDYGPYTLYVTDEIGFQKEVSFVLQTQEVVKPVAEITYSPSTRTNGVVVATISFDQEDVTITNNEGKNTYTFNKNESFTFEYVSSQGVTDSKEATVDWISPVDIEKTYTILEAENKQYIKRIPVNTTAEEFLNNINVIDANYKLYDAFDNGIAKAQVLATCMKLQADSNQYILVVTGDVNGDGKVSSTDISQLKLHFVEATLLTGERLYAADMNMDNNVTLTDLSQLKAKIVGM